MHPQSGMDLKTLAKHFPGLSIQTNSVMEPSSPRRGHFISARSWLSQIKPGIFFYVKTTYSEHIWWSLQTILLLLCGFMGFAYVLKYTSRLHLAIFLLINPIGYGVKNVDNIWFSHRKIILAQMVQSGWPQTLMGLSWERMAPGH